MFVRKIDKICSKMSQTPKDKDASSGDGKRIILNKKNFVVWKRLTMVQIGSVNARTLEPDFMPYLNEYRRPVPPADLSNKLRRRPLVLTPVDGSTSASPTADGALAGDSSSVDEYSDNGQPLVYYDMGPFVCSTFAEFEQLNNVYKVAVNRKRLTRRLFETRCWLS